MKVNINNILQGGESKRATDKGEDDEVMISPSWGGDGVNKRWRRAVRVKQR